MENGSRAEEQGLLDLLIAVIRHIRLLVIAPLLVGIAGFAVAYLKPPIYVSEAILAMPEAEAKQAALMMVTPLVIDGVIDKLNLNRDKLMQQARDELVGQIRVKVTRDGLLRLGVGASTPAQAQLLTKALIESWLASTVPGELTKQELVARLAFVQKMLQSIDLLLERRTSEAPVQVNGVVAPDDRGLTLALLGELQAKYFAESYAIPRKLQGVSPEVVRLPPSLVSEPEQVGRAILFILLAATTFLLLLIGVLVKHLVVRYVNNAQKAADLTRLRAAFFSGKKP